jgi:hypothetical protein
VNAFVASGQIVSRNPLPADDGTYQIVMEVDKTHFTRLHLHVHEWQASKLTFGKLVTVIGSLTVECGIPKLYAPNVVFCTGGVAFLYGNVGKAVDADTALVVVDPPGAPNRHKGTWYEVVYPGLGDQVHKGDRVSVMYHPARLALGNHARVQADLVSIE